MSTQYEKAITKIMQKHFETTPKKMKKITTGICNEVYLVKIKDSEVIVRLNKENDEMRGAEKYIPLFSAKGIPVPTIIASDYSKKFVPFYYQVQSKIEGVDIAEAIPKLTTEELELLGKEVGGIIKKLLHIPTNGKFGFVYVSTKHLRSSLSRDILESIKMITERGFSTGILDTETAGTLKDLYKEYKPYFDSVRSRFCFDDMSSKNILIHKGAFSGLVDVDGVAYGDYLETVGCIMASWYGTEYGEIYTNAVMDTLKLSKKQRTVVMMYAYLNRVFWMCENGVLFNQNTKAVIDQKRWKKDKKIVDRIFRDLEKIHVR